MLEFVSNKKETNIFCWVFVRSASARVSLVLLSLCTGESRIDNFDKCNIDEASPFNVHGFGFIFIDLIKNFIILGERSNFTLLGEHSNFM